MTADSDIIHQQTEHRFVIALEQHKAILAYEINDDRIDFTSTFVPPALRGKGLAERLVRHGLSWAKAQKLEIHASCWYVQKFLTAD